MANKATLKTYFETGDLPSQSEMEALIDAYPSFDDQFATKYVKTEISSAQILALNTSPVQLVAAPGAGKMLSISEVIVIYNYGTITYATNTSDRMVHGTSGETLITIGVLGDTSSSIIFKGSAATGLSAADVINNAISYTVATGDPTAGDGTLTIHLWYRELTL